MISREWVEKLVQEILTAMGLDWKVFHIEEEKPHSRWWVRLRIPETSDLPDLLIDKADSNNMEASIRRQIHRMAEAIAAR